MKLGDVQPGQYVVIRSGTHNGRLGCVMRLHYKSKWPVVIGVMPIASDVVTTQIKTTAENVTEYVP